MSAAGLLDAPGAHPRVHPRAAPDFDRAEPGAAGRRARERVFLAAIVLLNYTLFRPSPVDVAFALAFALTAFCRQRLTLSALAYLLLVFVWFASLFQASMRFLDDEDVVFQMQKIGFAISIGLCACLVAVHWDGGRLRLFLRVWIVSALIAASLGIAGFVTGSEDLTWDGRAKGLFDDPNMYGAFLLPGLVGCVHGLLTGEGRRPLLAAAFLWLTLGILLSFSRVAISIYAILVVVQLVLLNRRALLRMTVYGAGAALALALVAALAASFLDGFDDKVLDRFTFAKDYDLGEQGRLGRYVGSIDFILSHPRGLGLLQFERLFPEPIHNIWISSFMNYGWSAGFAFTLIVMFAVIGSIRNYRLTRDPVCLTILLAWLGIATCAMLHEAERWRHLWLMTGLVWGVNPRAWALPGRADLPGVARRVPSSEPARPASPVGVRAAA